MIGGAGVEADFLEGGQRRYKLGQFGVTQVRVAGTRGIGGL